MPIVNEPEQPMDLDKYAKWLPTPKMARVLWGGLITVLLIFALDASGVDIRSEVAAVAPMIVAAVWGWAKAERTDRPGLPPDGTEE